MSLQLLLYIALAVGAFGMVLAVIAIDIATHRLSNNDYNELVDYVDEKVSDAVDSLHEEMKPKADEKASKAKESVATVSVPVSQPQPYYYEPQPAFHQPQPVFQQQTAANGFGGYATPQRQQPRQQHFDDLTIGFFPMNDGDSFTAISDIPDNATMFRVNFDGSSHQANGTFELTAPLDVLRANAGRIIGTSVSIRDNGTDLDTATRYIITHKGSVARMNNQWVIVTPVVLQLGK